MNIELLFESVYNDLENGSFCTSDYLTESQLSFANGSVIVEDEDNLLKNDPKLVKAINSNYTKVYNAGLEYLSKQIDTWYKESDGSYLYGINSASKLKKYMKLQHVRVLKFARANIFTVEILFNNSYHPKEFFGGHTFIMEFNFNKDYKFTNKINFSLEG